MKNLEHIVEDYDYSIYFHSFYTFGKQINNKHVESCGYITHLTFRMPEALYITMRKQNMPDGRCLESRAISLMVNSKTTKVVVSNLKRIEGDNIPSL